MAIKINNYQKLIHFYKDLILELNLKKETTFRSECILNNKFQPCYSIIYHRSNYAIYDNNKIILPEEYCYDMFNQNILLGLVFHPLDKEGGLCSNLLIEDSIFDYLSLAIYRIFLNVLKLKSGVFQKEYEYYFQEKLKSISPKNNSIVYGNHIDKLPKCNHKILRKWDNLFTIVNAISFSKNLIEFSIEISDSRSFKVEFSYPLFDYLKNTHNNTIFGIYFADSEIELLKKIYQLYIIDEIEQLFQKVINIPQNANSFSEFYAIVHVYLEIKKLFKNKYNQKYLKKSNEKIKNGLENLNEYASGKLYTFDPSLLEKIQKLDKKSYENELKIRQEYDFNWILPKDNKMQKNKQQPAVTENNNIVQIINKFGQLIEYDSRQYLNKIKKFNTDILVQEYRDNYQKFKNNQEWNEIFYWQNIVLDILRNDGGGLWFDTRIKKYCFRSKFNASIVEVDSNELGDLLTRALKDKIKDYSNQNKNVFISNQAIEIVFVSKLKGINKQILNTNEKADNVIKILIFENEILTIDDDVFNINNYEFFKNNLTDFFFTRNRFIPNDYLIKRYQKNQLIATASTEQTFIEKFIYYLVKENQELSDYIMNWLAYYFQNLQKSKTALVLLSEKEVTKDIFWNIIIKEIFSKQYCTTIDDKECDTTLVSEIAKDKLFFHIGDIDDLDTKFDDETLALIIKDLLIKPSVTTDTNEEIYIHGQILITAKNPAPYLKKVLSKCTVIEIDNIDTIMEKLDAEDEAELEDAIYSDLNNFTDLLANYKIISENAEHRIDTEAREILKGNKSSNVNKDDINKQLDDFIQAIKDKDTDYFEKVYGTKDKKGGDVYEHLKYAFKKDDGYFIGQDMYLYYNAINEPPFKTNKALMDRLKVKDKMFRQEVKVLKILTKDGKEDVLFSVPSGGKETGNKDLYKIADYKLAEDIKIPDGATVISSQEKLDKYTFEDDGDIDNCIKRTKEYRAKKAEKEKKSVSH